MKIRKMFVANSSSATYIVKIPIDLNSFYSELNCEFDWNFFDINKVRVELLERKEELIKHMEANAELVSSNESVNNDVTSEQEERKQLSNSFRLTMLKYEKEHLEEIDGWLSKFETEDFKENKEDIKVKELLSLYYGVTVEYDEKDNATVLTSFTTMHNDYRDMNEIQKEILLYYLMDKKLDVTCERIDHDAERYSRFTDLREAL